VARITISNASSFAINLIADGKPKRAIADVLDHLNTSIFVPLRV